MPSLAAIDPFATYTTLIYIGLAIFGLVMIRIAYTPVKRKEQKRREDKAYANGYKRGFRRGLETPFRQTQNTDKP